MEKNQWLRAEATNGGDGAESNDIDNTASAYYAAVGGALFFVVVVVVLLACAKSNRPRRAKKRDSVTVGPRTEVWSFVEEENPDSSTQSHAAGNARASRSRKPAQFARKPDGTAKHNSTLADMDDISLTSPKQERNQVGPETYV